MTREILLVGSIPLGNAEEAFRTSAEIVGEHAARLPDGETGYARGFWFQCQWPYFLMHPLLEVVEPDPSNPENSRPARIPAGGIYANSFATYMTGRARVRAGVDPADVRFDDLGYADWGTASYEVFSRLKAEGVIPSSTRLQVCIPSTLVGGRICEAETFAEILPAYRDGLFGEIARLADAIDPAELSIQWDCVEPAVYEPGADGVRAGIRESLALLAAGVPDGVELGYHLCYGNFEGRHTIEPADLGACVELANGLTADVARPIDWFHAPVPVSRDDAAYFAPLADLRIEGDLFLGLVHDDDGLEGAGRRIEAATAVRSDFGIATECGFGRRPPENVPALLELHVGAAQL